MKFRFTVAFDDKGATPDVSSVVEFGPVGNRSAYMRAVAFADKLRAKYRWPRATVSFVEERDGA